METRVVRINGTDFRVPWDEFPDPHPDRAGGTCKAEDPSGVGVCTLDVHAPDILHIAHGGEGEVIAMWGEPAVITSSDFGGSDQ